MLSDDMDIPEAPLDAHLSPNAARPGYPLYEVDCLCCRLYPMRRSQLNLVFLLLWEHLSLLCTIPKFVEYIVKIRAGRAEFRFSLGDLRLRDRTLAKR